MVMIAFCAASLRGEYRPTYTMQAMSADSTAMIFGAVTVTPICKTPLIIVGLSKFAIYLAEWTVNEWAEACQKAGIAPLIQLNFRFGISWQVCFDYHELVQICLITSMNETSPLREITLKKRVWGVCLGKGGYHKVYQLLKNAQLQLLGLFLICPFCQDASCQVVKDSLSELLQQKSWGISCPAQASQA